MQTPCTICHQIISRKQSIQLPCQLHFTCQQCVIKFQSKTCCLCAQPNQHLSIHSESQYYLYPIQGTMVNYHKIYNKNGEGEFMNQKNCKQKTIGWVMLILLATIFMFAGVAMTVATSQKGTGVIMAILGLVGIIAGIVFAVKIKRIQKAHQNTNKNQQRETPTNNQNRQSNNKQQEFNNKKRNQNKLTTPKGIKTQRN